MVATPEPQARVDAVVERVRQVYGKWRRNTSAEQMRADWDELFWNDSQPCDFEDTELGSVPVRVIAAPGVNTQRACLYFHGGGYKMGSVVSHHDLMVRISAAADCQVVGVNYRLNPEHRFPAPLEDGMAVYRALLAAGHAGQNLALAGDSAGGGIAASLLLSIRDQTLPQPCGAVLLSAWLDMSLSGDSYASCAKSDPIHQKFMLQAIAGQYLGEGVDPAQPGVSPLFGDLQNLPPVLLQVAEGEVGRDDSVAFAEKLQASGGQAELSVWSDMIHVFQQFADDLPEARQAIAQIGEFLQAQWGPGAAQ
ncbi:alpha/beta hydrolase [Spongiibacter taiwanensis]|uniref:alpha/beta hydrolase n=1 Tax=Spongiibacter taiwanensis TaxID=1748242 RepID=UPI002034D046|nr:alpha/beta hydrolase [Spongiibacter taiwanensis]USA42591.1 alpha/beta hydrolase [Spongiibacter taiwanensis]